MSADRAGDGAGQPGDRAVEHPGDRPADDTRADDPTADRAGDHSLGRATDPAGQPSWLERWETALTELELDLRHAEACLHKPSVATTPPSPWQPPSDLGPLPAPLAARAEALYQRQVELARRMTEALSMNRRHARVAQELRAGPAAGPVYVDTSG